ncbi:MAG: hypothetical protein H6815_04945 [Phycisphaeraceae bacterium]|nr:hypothetical protein [Phycisphaerales bacterium]MCB9859782.1 hypothetical protein [Phycisphaeraceae bacterium]
MTHTQGNTHHESASLELVAPTLGWPMRDGGAAVHSQLHVYRVGDRVVASITHESLRERQALLLREDLTHLLDDCTGFVALGMERVEMLGSAAAGEIVRAANVCADRHGRLVVFGLRDELARDLQHSGMFDGVTRVRTKDEALELLMRCTLEPAGTQRKSFWHRRKSSRAA